jgi:hypothetical protein
MKHKKRIGIVCKKETCVMKIIELLVKYGMVMNLKYVSLLLSAGEVLVNLERFGIKYDEDLYFECYVNEFYPQEYMNKFTIDRNVLIMRKYMHCNVPMKKCIKFIKKYNLKLDGYTLEFAILNKNKLGMKLLDEYNICVATLYKKSVCLQGNLPYYHFNKLLFRNFIEQNKITKDMMMFQYDINL